MNCQQTQDVLPLYVGSELAEEKARFVSAHLQNCETCSGAAREYRETRQLLQMFVPPTFSEDSYAEMRQSVWQNLEKKSTGPAFFSVVASFFSPRLAWALASAVLIIAISVLGIYVISRRGDAPHSVVSKQPSRNQITPIDQSGHPVPNETVGTRLPALSGRNPLTAGPRSRPRNPIQARVGLPAVSKVAPVSPPAIPASQVSDSRHLDYGSSGASHTPVRMEIQTKNPNIRIIWLTSRDAKSSSPNSKGI
jgi:Putative zinc-finger